MASVTNPKASAIVKMVWLELMETNFYSSLPRRLLMAAKKHQHANANGEGGFTLVELMIVIVIVGVLSAIALPNFLNQTTKAKATEAKTISSAYLKQYYSAYLEDPSTASSAIACPAETQNFEFTCNNPGEIVATGQNGVSGTVTSSVNTTTGAVTMGSLQAQ